MFDPKTPIEYVITVEALKEGWDCSFAYVFCSVQRIKVPPTSSNPRACAADAYAKRRALSELNRAYAHVAEPVFTEAAKALVDKLVQMGFDDTEARENIENSQYELDADGLFAPREKPAPVFRQSFEASPETIEALRQRGRRCRSVRTTEAGKVEVAVTGYLAPTVEAAIAKAMPTASVKEFTEAARKYRAEVHRYPLARRARRGIRHAGLDGLGAGRISIR